MIHIVLLKMQVLVFNLAYFSFFLKKKYMNKL